MKSTQIYPYRYCTLLDLEVFKKFEGGGSVIKIKTPHKGIVIIELNQIDRGMFTSATEISKETEKIIVEISRIEDEAKTYLLKEWLSK